MKTQSTLIITELFMPTKGGTAVWFDQVYRLLGGKNQHILTAQVDGSQLHDHHHPNSIHRITLKRVSWLKPESLLMYLNLFTHSIGLCLRHKITTIHAGRVLPEGAIALICSKLLRIPCVIYAHGEEITTWQQHPNKCQAMRWVYQHCDTIIANSQFTQGELIKFGIAGSKITQIHPGVDTEFFQPNLPCADLRQQLNLAPDDTLLLSVGRLSRRKGFDTVIKSLALLNQQALPVHYALIGIGEDLAYLAALAQTYGVTDQVHFLGHVEPDDLPRWYNACTLFVMPNREVNGDTEGFGMVYIEAAACGKTAISGKVGGPPNAVLDRVTGLNIDGENVEQLAVAITELVTNQALKLTLEHNAQQRVLDEMTWQKVATATQDLINC